MHLLIDISAHGYGHVAQTAPVLAALRARLPGLQLSIRSAAPHHLLAARIAAPFTHIPIASDFGMVMDDALHVNADASLARYHAVHATWPATVTQLARELTQLKPDLVLSNISYLMLAAAQAAGIPALAMCSLHWADIFAAYCGVQPEAAAIHAQMQAAYQNATAFLRLQPGMPMTSLQNTCPVGVVATRGHTRRERLLAQLGASTTARVLLISLGGVASRLPVADWPRVPDLYYLVPGIATGTHPHAFDTALFDLPFQDLLASCDVFIGKPGYGSFVEAAVTGTPVLYVARDDWPEAAHLIAWLQQHARCLDISTSALWRGDFMAAVAAVLAQPARPPVAPLGNDVAADLLATWLQRK